MHKPPHVDISALTDGADRRTIEVSQSQTHELADSFEAEDRGLIVGRVRELFNREAHILEIGSGSGADAAALTTAGFDITPTDASPAMVAIIAKRFPALRSKAKVATLPGPLPFQDAEFDGAIAITVLQHLALTSLPTAFAELHRVLAPGARFYVCAFDARSDLDSDSRDKRGRLQTLLPPPTLLAIAEAAGFGILHHQPFVDVLKRSGIFPREYLFERQA